jgi:hypothetical protein
MLCRVGYNRDMLLFAAGFVAGAACGAALLVLLARLRSGWAEVCRRENPYEPPVR